MCRCDYHIFIWYRYLSLAFKLFVLFLALSSFPLFSIGNLIITCHVAVFFPLRTHIRINFAFFPLQCDFGCLLFYVRTTYKIPIIKIYRFAWVELTIPSNESVFSTASDLFVFISYFFVVVVERTHLPLRCWFHHQWSVE